MTEKEEKLYKKYKTVEARQLVDYVCGLTDKCYYNGLLNKSDYPQKEVLEIVEGLADEIEYAKTSLGRDLERVLATITVVKS